MGVIPAHADEARTYHAPQNATPTTSTATSAATVAATGTTGPRAVLDELARTRAGLPNPCDAETLEDAKHREQTLSGIDRKRLLDDLFAMEMLSQQARARGIHTRPGIVAEAELQYKTLLAQQLVRELIAEIETHDSRRRSRHGFTSSLSKRASKWLDHRDRRRNPIDTRHAWPTLPDMSTPHALGLLRHSCIARRERAVFCIHPMEDIPSLGG